MKQKNRMKVPLAEPHFLTKPDLVCYTFLILMRMRQFYVTAAILVSDFL